MRWIVTLSGRRDDIDRLEAESFAGLSRVPSDQPQLLFELDNPEDDVAADVAPHAAKAVVDAAVRHINGFGKLRWGRTFEGVSGSAIKTVDNAGNTSHRVFLEPAVAHMLPEDFADMIERLGHPKPPLPTGIEVVNALEGAAVTTLAEANPDVGRVLHLVNLMLQGDDEIDWVAGYSALDAIDHDLASRELNGVTLGWWSKKDRSRFSATANSVEVLGFHARHGKPSGVTEARMTTKDASWFVRRVTGRWLGYLLAID